VRECFSEPSEEDPHPGEVHKAKTHLGKQACTQGWRERAAERRPYRLQFQLEVKLTGFGLAIAFQDIHIVQFDSLLVLLEENLGQKLWSQVVEKSLNGRCLLLMPY